MGDALELSPVERRVVQRVREVRGMTGISDAMIARHLRDIFADRDTPSADCLLADALRFRDYWNDRRRNQGGDWRGWRTGMTNWFSRTADTTTRNGQQNEELDWRTAQLVANGGGRVIDAY